MIFTILLNIASWVLAAIMPIFPPVFQIPVDLFGMWISIASYAHAMDFVLPMGTVWEIFHLSTLFAFAVLGFKIFAAMGASGVRLAGGFRRR